MARTESFSALVSNASDNRLNSYHSHKTGMRGQCHPLSYTAREEFTITMPFGVMMAFLYDDISDGLSHINDIASYTYTHRASI